MWLGEITIMKHGGLERGRLFNQKTSKSISTLFGSAGLQG
jgi:hypothetical protein